MPSLLRSVYSVLSGRLVGILTGIIFTPLLVRIVSREQYGTFASVMAALSIFTLLSKGGLFDSIRKNVAEHRANAEDLSTVITASVVLTATYGVGATAAAVLSLIGGVVPPRYATHVWVLLGGVLFGNVFTLSRGYFYGVQQEHLGEALNVVQRLIYTVTGLLLAYIGYGLVGVFAGYTLSFVVVGLAGLVMLYRHSSVTFHLGDRFSMHIKEVSAYGAFQLVGGLSAVLLYKTDILLVEFFHGPGGTALYKSAIVPAELIWFVPSVIQAAFLQEAARNWSVGEIDKINENLKAGVKYSVLALTLFGGGLFVLAEPFLTVYFTGEYSGAETTLKVLIVGSFFMGITRPVNAVLQATGRIRQTELFSVGVLLLNVLLNLFLIPRFGILGAGVGTAVSYVVMFGGRTLLWHWSPFKLVSLQWAARLLFVQVLFFAGFSTIVSLVDLRPLVALIVFPPVGLGFFVAVNVLAGYFHVSRICSQLKATLNDL